MSFVSQEESAEQGSPIELFLFENIEGEFTFTSGNVPVVFDSRTFEPLPIKTTEDEIETLNDQRAIAVTMPTGLPFLDRYVGTIPTSPDFLTIYRQHESDGGTPETVEVFNGEVSGVSFNEDGTATANAKSEASKLSRSIPMQTTRNLCNHILYDTRCQVVAADFRFAVTVVGIASNDTDITVSGSGLSSQLASDPTFFNLGTFERSGLERRMIRAVTDLGSDQAVFSVLFPFTFIDVGLAMQAFAGCDHQFPTCRDKFNNQDRYGGFPFVPQKNLFRAGVDS